MTDLDTRLEALADRAWHYLAAWQRDSSPVLVRRRNDRYRWRVHRDTFEALLRTDPDDGPIAGAIEHPAHVEPSEVEWSVRLFGIPVVPVDTDDTDLLLLVVAEPDRG